MLYLLNLLKKMIIYKEIINIKMQSNERFAIRSFRSFNTDELFLVAIHLDLPDLMNFCLINKQTVKLCQKDRIWNYKLQNDFPDYSNDFNTISNINGEIINNIRSKLNKYKLLYELNKIKEIFNLKYNLVKLYNLQEFFAHFEKIEVIPKEICKLRNLRRLILSDNRIQFLPTEIGHLQNLKTFDLSNNRIENLPKEIGDLQNLEILYLSDNKIKSLPKQIGHLQNLEILYLNKNKIETLPKEIGKLHNLLELDLSDNRIQLLPKEIGHLQNLKRLYLKGNKIII